MSDIAVINFTECKPTSILASSKIAKYISKKLNADLIDTKEKCKLKKYKFIFIVNGIFLYCNFKEELLKLCELNNNFIWVGNDYNSNMGIPSSIYKIFKNNIFTLISAYDNYKHYEKYEYLNWNKLTFISEKEIQIKIKPKYFGLSYFGAFRENRVEYFKKYMENPPYNVYISTTSENNKNNFYAINNKIKFFTPPSIVPSFGLCNTALYIEDKNSHKIYTSPANRFYEYLSCGNLILFDKSCIWTFEKANIDILPYIVNNAAEFNEKMGDNALKQKQRNELYLQKNYKKELDEEFYNCMLKIGVVK